MTHANTRRGADAQDGAHDVDLETMRKMIAELEESQSSLRRALAVARRTLRRSHEHANELTRTSRAVLAHGHRVFAIQQELDDERARANSSAARVTKLRALVEASLLGGYAAAARQAADLCTAMAESESCARAVDALEEELRQARRVAVDAEDALATQAELATQDLLIHSSACVDVCKPSHA